MSFRWRLRPTALAGTRARTQPEGQKPDSELKQQEPTDQADHKQASPTRQDCSSRANHVVRTLAEPANQSRMAAYEQKPT